MSDKRCTATKANGEQCRKPPRRGYDTCKQHSGDPDVGQPTKLTEDMQHRIGMLVRNGNYVETACAASGIGVSTYYSWRERGEADRERGIESIYAEFLEAVTRAIAESEAILVQRVQQAAERDGRLALEVLGRRFPDRWRGGFEARHSGGVRHSGHVITGGEPERVIPDDAERLAEVARVLRQIGALGPLPAADGDEP